MRHIVEISVDRMIETCQRTTYFVRLTTDEGMRMEVDSFSSHCIYDDMAGRKGLPVAEARDRALTSAWNFGDFLELAVTPYVEDGVTYEPTMKLERYTMEREERAEDAARAAASL